MRCLIAAASLCALMSPALALGADLGAEVLAQLKKTGSDVSKRHAFEFYFYLPDEDRANALARELQDRGLATRVSRGPDDPNWLCLATMTMVPETAKLEELGRLFEALAQKHRAEFDGWEADPVR
jgi:regulator of ribonuclease activity B